VPAEPNEEQLSPIVPFLHYADLDAAAEWLPLVFDLRLRSIEREPSGQLRMAVLQHGSGIIFARREPNAKGLSGGRLYVYVDDVDAHHAHVQAQHVEASPPRDEPWGDRAYSTHDLQGHPWTFATPIKHSG
jgi:MerR family transcriptional regulator, thiopeptide resistance regulator